MSGSEIATAAIAHLAHSRPANQVPGALSCMDFVDAEVCDVALTHEDGCMFVHHDAPGLGCEPRPDAPGPCVARFG